MPLRKTATKVSLLELADLAIGTPEVGAVNFTALHKLLVAILKNLHLQDTVVDIQSLSPEQSHLFEVPRPLPSTVQVGTSKERQKDSMASMPAQTPESGGVVRALSPIRESGVARTPSQMLESDAARKLDQMPSLMLESRAASTPAQLHPLAPERGATRMPAQTRESEMAKALAQTLQSQVKDLGGQVHDLDRQFKTMENQVQGILTHMQHVTALASGLDVDTPEWLAEQEVAAAPMPEKAELMPGAAKLMPEMATSMPDKEPTGLVKIKTDRPQAMQLLQNVMKDVKTLKQAQEKTQGQVQEFPEKLLQRIEEVEKKLRDREELLEQLAQKSMISTAEDVTMVTWEDLEQAITDGWKATVAGPETMIGLPKHRRQTITPSDVTLSGAIGKPSTLDQAMDFDQASSFGPEGTPGISGSGQPSEEVFRRGKSRAVSATGFPGREQYPRAHDEAGLAKGHQPPVSQFAVEPDHPRPGEQLSIAHLRRDEQDEHPGAAPQDFTSARDGHRRVSPDPRGGVYVGPDQSYVRPGQDGFGPPGLDQRAFPPLSTYPHGVVPLSKSQLGVIPPGMSEQGLVPPGLGQHGMVPLLAPSRDQQGLELPGTGQPGMVPLSTYEHGMRLPGPDQRGLEQSGMDERGAGPLGMDQPGLVPFGRDQYGFAGPGMDQQGLLPLPTEQSALASPGLMQVATDQRAFVQPISQTPGFMPSGIQQHDVVPPGTSQFYQPDMVPPGAGQPGLVQPGAGQPGLIPPGMDQLGLVPPAAGQPGLVQPGAGQPGLIPPGMDQLGLAPPAAGQPGLVPPGIGQPGLVPPGMDQRGLVQPGMGQPGFMQPGMGQHVLVPPGLDWRGFVQPGAGQPGLVPPGMDQPGLIQPGMDQPGLVQPGTGQPSFIQPGAGQPGLVPPGMDQSGLVQPGAGQPGLVPPGMDQSGLVQPGAGQPGLVPPGMDQSGLVQPSAGQPGLVPPGMDQSGLVPSGASQPGLVQPGADQHDLVPHGVDQPGLVQPGAGQPSLVQPGTGQPGLVLPGMDQSGLVQPVAGQPGLVRPGTDQHDLVQPRVDLHGLVQPHIYPHGFFQPTMYPPGLLQPGAYPPGLVQPGAYPHGLVQPRIYQHGLRQLDADQQGLAPSGTESHRFPAIYADSGSLTSPRPYQHALVPPGQDQQGQVSALLARQGLTSPGLAPTRIFQQSLMPPAMYQHGPTPLSRGVPSYQQHLVPPGLYQGGLMDTGPQGPGYPGVAQYVRIGLDQKQPEISRKTTPSKEGTFFRSSGHQFSQEVPSERKDSLEKLTPSFPMAVETFRLMGELISLYVELKENMKSLDKEKAGQTDLEKIQYLLAQMVHKTIPPDLQEQLKTLKTLAKEIRQEKIKLDRMQRILEDEGHLDTGKKMKASQLGLQLGILRVTVADIEKELAELRESQERGKVSMEHSVSEASLYLQDQLDKLRTIIENMLASSSRLLSMSMAPGKSSGTLTPGSINPEATCPACSLDLSHQVSMLVQRYEQLQDMVNNLAVSRPSKKAKLQSQDEELLGHVQNAILQVQGDCEKLNITTSNLIEDHQQKQKDIDVLYQGLEKLKKEKASRAHLDMEIHVKADKSALESKVSRVQFDATTEQLNHMMQELVAKMNGQEQDWQKMLDRLLTEMDSKLDRLELDPLKQLLEDRWKSLRQQLKERSPLYQADEAAAMRRQLLAHFHCLSCDRPLETPVTGQIIPVTPVGPSLPGHRSTRPYTIFELEQVRQHSRSLKLGGTALPRADLAQTEQSVGRLRTMHSKMLMDIEKVQIHFGGSVKASSQMIRELLQTQCLSHPCYKRAPEVADYTYWSVPRRCGGSHTLTYPYRRNRLQHLPQGLYPNEEIQIAMKHDEVDILGFDGHIYKGRMDTKLPGIPTKDNSAMSKHRAKPSRPHVHRQQSLVHNSQPPSRPQSAQMLAGNASASSHEQTDRPVSSQGRLSQPNVAHPSSPIEMAAGLGMHIDVPPGEGLEEPTRGPRSSTPH